MFFVPHLYKINLIKTLVCRTYNICCTWTSFAVEIDRLEGYLPTTANSYMFFNLSSGDLLMTNIHINKIPSNQISRLNISPCLFIDIQAVRLRINYNLYDTNYFLGFHLTLFLLIHIQ